MTITMTFEQKEVWLNRAFKLHREQPSLKEELDEVRRRYDECTDISNFGSGKTPTEEKYVGFANATDSYDKAVRDEYEHFRAVKAEIAEAIKELPDSAERAVLRARFLRFKTLKNIAKQTNYSLSYVKKLKRRGIEHIRIKEDT
ncbi:MAG: hypothetical protein IJ555_03050 [Ruminococcus sp.]|nr:hypothetical protein [Ruminococcus sp.]